VWWAIADKRRPVVVIQADFMNRSASAWVLSVPLTTNLSYAEAPGNVRLSKRETRLARSSVANVSQVAALPRAGFAQRVARLSGDVLERIDAGLRLVMELG
jgi:mRNA interferase MazF